MIYAGETVDELIAKGVGAAAAAEIVAFARYQRLVGSRDAGRAERLAALPGHWQAWVDGEISGAAVLAADDARSVAA